MDRLGSSLLRQLCPLTDDQAAEMLHDARTAGLVKLHCGKGFITELQEWADPRNQVRETLVIRSVFIMFVAFWPCLVKSRYRNFAAWQIQKKGPLFAAPISDQVTDYFVAPTSGLGSDTKPSAFGISTLASASASSVVSGSSLMMSARPRT